MSRRWHGFYRGIFLVAFLLMGVGCASLKPSASSYPPETGGGFKMSDQCAGVLGVLSPAFYFVGEWLASTSACR